VFWSFQTYDGSGGGGNANDSSRQGDDIGVDSGGGSKRELTGDLSDDNKAITSGHGMWPAGKHIACRGCCDKHS